ncbi:S1C family serine protease [Phenylobacterium sp.]|uniref:S1C family serine protease n=1 Tax=Phenylobacterium sp. TaxID=1871053 RepID=UPI0025DFB136|nr:S1C family serine protease [Phenylobacterium sp.]
MRRLLAAALIWSVAQTAVAQAPPDAKQTELVVPPLPAGSVVRPVALTRTGAQVREDQRIGTFLTGTLCVQPVPVTWKDLAPELTALKEIFAEELQTAGFKPDADPGNLFADTQASPTDLQMGAMVKGADVSYCDSVVGTSGKLTLAIQWQIYSSLRREIVGTVDTSETVQVKRLGRTGQARSLGQMAFAANVRALMSNERFRQIVTSSDPSGVSAPTAGQKIVFTPGPSEPVPMAQASGSVVAILAGGGHGSGMLVGSEGYILTNEHVVGSAKTVRVRWSDGLETSGEVLRTNKRRDVALVKTDPRGRTPLITNRQPPPLGAAVFAIGTPLDPALQNTVTRGIISASRIIEGFNFIQSDTPVTHGNSGGPLLDEKGAVIGITAIGIDPSAGSTLNFFIPIGDALDFLGLNPAG